MPALTEPDARLAASFAAAIDEFIAEGRGAPDDNSLTGMIIRDHARGPGHDWVAPFLALEHRWRTVGPAGFVPFTVMWWTDGDEYLGRIAVRHVLNEHLRDVGGHIGYDMRPTARRRGHATAMLAAALPLTAALGIEKALITCDADNIGSRKVIERNGGVLEDRRGDKLRYWVPTGTG